MSAARLLFLPALFAFIAAPRTRYAPADEASGLLGNGRRDEEGNGGEQGEEGSSAPTPANGRETQGYGTFNQNGTPNPKPSSSHLSAEQGASTPSPAQGKQSITIPKKLGEIKKEDKPLKWREVLARVWSLSDKLWPSTSRPLQFAVMGCIFIMILGRVMYPVSPLLLGQIVRGLTARQTNTPGPSPWPPFIAYFVVRVTGFSSGLLFVVRQMLWMPVSQYTDREMTLLCFNHLLNLSLAYHTKRNTGEVLKVIDRGSAINSLFSVFIFNVVPAILDIGVGFGVFLFLYGPLLASFTLVIMVTYIVLTVSLTQSRTTIRRELMEKDVKQRGIISDVLTNWESVKYFTAETRESKRYREAIVSYQESEAAWNTHYRLLTLMQNFLLALGLMIGSLLIAFRVLQGSADAAELVVFIQYFQQLAGPLDQFGFILRQLNQQSIDAEKMFALLAETTEVHDKPGAKELVVTDGIIEFENVHFSYDGGETEALKGISFRIGKGQSMALVGESGSGKSTILRCLYRFYDLQSGRILIDGQDISQVTQLSLRRAIGIVPQDSVLWNDTIGANISYGKEGAEDDEIIEAAQRAKLHERILSFSDQYATIVGERGIRLSGGEKQRVSLARMFLKSPAILVLDEATSALDTETEREIQRSLAELSKGRTSLSIAHRLSTIINSDQIVVMKDGEVIELGSYKELVQQDGAFATMWNKQIHTEAEMIEKAEKAAASDNEATSGGGTEESVLAPDVQEEQLVATASETEAINAPDVHTTAETEDNVASGVAPTEASSVEPVSGATEVVEEPAQPETSRSTTGGQNGTVSSGHEGLATAESANPIATSSAVKEAGPVDNATVLSPVPAQPASVEGSKHDEVKSSEPQPVTGSDDVPMGVDSPAIQSSPQKSMDESATSTAATTPSRDDKAPVPFPKPPMPRMSTSASQQSNLSGSSAPEVSSPPADDTKGDKRRKRLSSIKGFVRRISDQGGMTRSNSYGKSGTGTKSPMGELSEAAAMGSGPGPATPPTDADKKKKRLSRNLSGSTR